MAGMAFCITNGSRFIKLGPHGKPEADNNLSKARMFDDKIQADNFCLCLPKMYKKQGYYVMCLDDRQNSNIPAIQPIQETTSESVIEEPEEVVTQEYNLEFDLDSTEKIVAEFEDFVLNLKEHRDAIVEQQNYIEAQIFDLEHAAEFFLLDLRRGFMLYKKLHDARVLRRKCKDALFVLDYFDDVLGDRFYKRELTRRIGGLQNREFTPRTGPAIFEGIRK